MRFADDGRLLLVAARNRTDADDSGLQDGAVYSYEVQTNGELTFRQRLAPPERRLFGSILDAEGQWAAIGESGDEVRLYRLNNGSWTESQLLRLTDVPATTGVSIRDLDASIAISGDLLAIGDTSTNINLSGVSRDNAGSVILFRRGADNRWRHEATLIAPLPESSFEFGAQVALSGDTLLVGAPNDAIEVDGSSTIVGGAYVFRRSGGNWSHVRTLRDPDPVLANRRFGWSVALDDNIAVVGCASCGQPESGESNTGAFFTYRRDLGGSEGWGLVGKNVALTPDSIDNFSFSLRLRHPVLLVGATGNGARRASFFIANQTGTWTRATELQEPDATFTSFGASVDFWEGIAVVGATRWPNDSRGSWGAISSWYSRSVASCGGNFDAVFCDRFEVLTP
ncbi:MAG: FG-GAP repeat protein [Wenzhouxiangella sp.]